MKKLLSLLMIIGIILSTVSGTFVFADETETEATTTAVPEVLLYRDYDDGKVGRIFNSGTSSSNITYNFGTLNMAAAGKSFGVMSSAYNGGIQINMKTETTTNSETSEVKTTYTYNYNASSVANKLTKNNTSLTSGILYIGFDIAIKQPEDCNATTGAAARRFYVSVNSNAKYPINIFARYSRDEAYYSGGMYTTGTSSSSPSSSTAHVKMTPEQVYRVEAIWDINNGTFARYLDGILVGSVISDNTYKSVTKLTVNMFEGIHYFDNLAIVHYPDATTVPNMQVTAEQKDKNSLTIGFTNTTTDVDVVVDDSDTEDDTTTTSTKTYTAVVNETVDLTADDITVTNSTGIVVTGYTLEKGEAGAYNIIFADTLTDKSYTVTVNNANLAGKTGATLVTTGDNTTNTATVNIVQPEILLYRNYDDVVLQEDGTYNYNDGTLMRLFNSSSAGTWSNYSSGLTHKYGTINMAASGDYYGGTSYYSLNNDGNFGAKFKPYEVVTAYSSSDNALGSMYGSLTGSLTKNNNTLTTGKLYMGFDVMIEKPEDITKESSTFRVLTGADSSALQGSNVVNIVAKYTDTENVAHTGGILKVPGRVATANADDYVLMNPGELYRVEVVFDLDAKTAYRYLDGEQIGDPVASSTMCDGATLKRFYVYITDGIEYFDNFTIIHYPTGSVQSFDLTAGADASKTKITAGFKNIETDVDVEVNDNGTEDDTSDDTTTTTTYKALINETVALTASDVTVTDSDGNAVAVSSVTKSSTLGMWDINLAEELADGTYTVSVNSGLTSVSGASIDASSAVVTVGYSLTTWFADEEGNEIDDLTNVEANDKIRACVKIDGTIPEGGVVLLGGLYNGGLLKDGMVKTVTTAEDYVELTVDSITDLAVKVFVWDNLTGLKPLIDVVKLPN